MLMLIAALLALIPAVAILYPFLRRRDRPTATEEEGPLQTVLVQRWESALHGLKNTELDRAIGHLTDEDYHLLREEYMTEAALAMKAMDLEEALERELFSGLRAEVRTVREKAVGGDGSKPRDEGLAD